MLPGCAPALRHWRAAWARRRCWRTFSPHRWFAGTVLTLFSAFCFGAAVWRELVPRFNDPLPNAPRIPKWILFAVNGTLTLVALAAMVSLWLAR